MVDAVTAQEVRLRVDVPADQPAGHYHGLVLISAATDPGDHARVLHYLALQPAERSAALISQILTMMHNHGSVAFADEFARGIARSAAVAFEEAFAGAPDSPARRFIGDLIPYMVERDR